MPHGGSVTSALTSLQTPIFAAGPGRRSETIREEGQFSKILLVRLLLGSYMLPDRRRGRSWRTCPSRATPRTRTAADNYWATFPLPPTGHTGHTASVATWFSVFGPAGFRFSDLEPGASRGGDGHADTSQEQANPPPALPNQLQEIRPSCLGCQCAR